MGSTNRDVEEQNNDARQHKSVHFLGLDVFAGKEPKQGVMVLLLLLVHVR